MQQQSMRCMHLSPCNSASWEVGEGGWGLGGIGSKKGIPLNGKNLSHFHPGVSVSSSV